jgi:hypothetical protein
VDASSNLRSGLHAWLVLVAAAFAIATPILYSAGKQFDSAYLAAYGVDSDLFPKAIQEYLLLGAAAFIRASAASLTSILEDFQGMYWQFSLSLLVAWLWVRLQEKGWKKIIPEGLRSGGVRQSFIGALFVFTGPLFAIAAIVLSLGLVVILLIMPFQIGTDAGKTTAQEQIKQRKDVCVKSQNGNGRSCTLISRDGNVVAHGKLVAASDKFLAVFEGGRTVIIETRGTQITVSLPDVAR